MNLEEKMKDLEERFNELSAQRNKMNEDLIRMQGEYKALEDLKKEQESKEATEAEVVEG